MTTPNHSTALTHARDVASDPTRTPSQRNLARAYLELRERVTAIGQAALLRIDCALLGSEEEKTG